jgi:chondroitin 4-sulfotransferase 11/chondroitin 4-sulfotransferase 13
MFHSIVIGNFAFKFRLDEEEQNPKYFDSLYKFVFVRHPFERLVSAYYEKFVKKRDPNFIRSLIYHVTPPDLLFKASINKYLFNKSTKSNFRITFEKFVKFVIHEIRNKVISYGTYHWMPFTDFCGLCHIHYDLVSML